MNWEQHFRNVKPSQKAKAVKYSKEYLVGFGSDVGFGAMARGIPVPGQPKGTVVIPPGRYWIDAYGDKRQVLLDWFDSKPEVHVETSQESSSDPLWDRANSSPDGLFSIFSIPKGVNNFNLEGVWFPTTVLGFPTIAPSVGPAAVVKKDDTVQKPDAPTSTEIAEEIAKSLGKITGAGTQGLIGNLSSSTMITLGLVAGAVLLVMLLPGMLAKHAVHAAI